MPETQWRRILNHIAIPVLMPNIKEQGRIYYDGHISCATIARNALFPVTSIFCRERIVNSSHVFWRCADNQPSVTHQLYAHIRRKNSLKRLVLL